MENKHIFEMTNDEIISEMRDILKMPDLTPPGRDKIGFITENSNEYVEKGKVDAKSLQKIYNRDTKLLKEYALTLAINSLRNRQSDLFSLIKIQKRGCAVLDYGCGAGAHGIACTQNGSKVGFFDISIPMLNLTEDRYKRRNLKYERYESEKHIPFDIFTAILCSDVIEHHPRPDLMLSNFIKYLRIGGVAHLHISPHVNYNRGHLAESITIWNGICKKLLKKHFLRLTKNNYKLIKKG